MVDKNKAISKAEQIEKELKLLRHAVEHARSYLKRVDAAGKYDIEHFWSCMQQLNDLDCAAEQAHSVQIGMERVVIEHITGKQTTESISEAKQSVSIGYLKTFLACEIECSVYEEVVLPAIELMETCVSDHKYDQQALELCEKCGWKTVVPDEGCLNCMRVNAVKMRERCAQKVDHIMKAGGGTYGDAIRTIDIGDE